MTELVLTQWTGHVERLADALRQAEAARVDALVHAPATFRRRGVYVAAQESGVA